MRKISETTKFLILMVFAMLAWGGSWTSAKLVANVTAPEVLIFWRFLATFVSFVPVFLVMKKSLKVDRKSLLYMVLGSLWMVAYNKMFFSGLRTGLAGAGGVLVTSLNPILTFSLTALLFRQPIKRKEAAGLLLGLGGGLILLEIWAIGPQEIFMGGNAFFLLATFLWSLLTITTHKASGVHSLVFSFYVYGISTLLDFFLALPYGVFGVIHAGYSFWFNIVYLSVCATTFGTTAYFFASGKLGASRASSFMFLVPTSAVLISWLVLKEQPKLSTIAGGILAMGAVYLINMRRQPGVQSNMQTLKAE